VVVAAMVAYAVIFLDGYRRSHLLIEGLTSITYTQDFYLGRGASTPDFGYLGATWSLGVEEQFYILWPFLLLLMMRHVKTLRMRAVFVGVAIVLATAWRAYLTWRGLSAHASLNLDGQGSALLVGCALGLVLPEWIDGLRIRRQRAVTAWAVAGLVVILGITSSAIPGVLMPLGSKQLIVALATAVIIIRLVMPATDTLGSRFVGTFSSRPAVWVGAVSYSLYLWHVPVIEMAKDAFGLETSTERAVAGPFIVGTAVLLAAASYYLVELRFLRMKRRYEQPAAVVVALDPGRSGRMPSTEVALRRILRRGRRVMPVPQGGGMGELERVRNESEV
jgi:peptidoglycan/LPS O-acetylase OafA/YrhL